MPAQSQASMTAGVDRQKKKTTQHNKIVTSSTSLKVGHCTVLMYYSCSIPKTLNREKGIKRIRACCPMFFLPSIDTVCSVALSGLGPDEN